jgi:hypothetical protein
MTQSSSVTTFVAAAKVLASDDPAVTAADVAAAAEIVGDRLEWQIGDNVFIQTATHFWTGSIVKIDDNSYWLAGTNCVFETGPLSAIQTGKFSNVESIPGHGIVQVMFQGIMTMTRPGA